MKVKHIKIVVAQPLNADIKKIQHRAAVKKKKFDEIVYLVKLYMKELPPVASTGYELHIGDDHIKKYSSFTKGIFFKVHDPDSLKEWAGKRVRFKEDDAQEFMDGGIDFPDFSSDKSLKEIRDKGTLPSQKEALKE